MILTHCENGEPWFSIFVGVALCLVILRTWHIKYLKERYENEADASPEDRP
jgi:hypothetical protein